MTPGTYPFPLIESAGLFRPSTGSIILAEEHQYIKKAVDSREVSSRAFAALLTQNHEAVHYIQSLTTAVVYSASFWQLEIPRETVRLLQANQLDAQALNRLRRDYETCFEILGGLEHGLATIDIVEGMAVTEAWVATASSPTHKNFFEWLDTAVPPKQSWELASKYRRAIDLIAHFFADRLAFKLMPLLGFISLNTDRPSHYFMSAIAALKEDPSLLDHPLLALFYELSKRLKLDVHKMLVKSGASLPTNQQHQILFPEMVRAAKNLNDEQRLSVGLQPGQYLRGTLEGIPEDDDSYLPYMITYSDGYARYLRTGVFDEVAGSQKQGAFLFFSVGSSIGIGERLLWMQDPYNACAKFECPLHRYRLCHAHPPPSSALTFVECLFSDILTTVSGGRTAEELMELRRQSLGNGH
jgi:hypothetical protein